MAGETGGGVFWSSGVFCYFGFAHKEKLVNVSQLKTRTYEHLVFILPFEQWQFGWFVINNRNISKICL